MSARRMFTTVICGMTLLLTQYAGSAAAQFGIEGYRYQGHRQHFSGEAAMIEALHAIGRAARDPLTSRGHIIAAQNLTRDALRHTVDRQAQFQLQAAAANLDSFSVTGDRYLLSAAFQNVQQALSFEQNARAYNVRRPIFTQPSPLPGHCGHGAQQHGGYVGGSVEYPYPYGGNFGAVPYSGGSFGALPYSVHRPGVTLQRGPFSVTIPLR